MGCGQDGRYAEARVPMDYAARQANAAVPMGDGLLAWAPKGWTVTFIAVATKGDITRSRRQRRLELQGRMSS